MTRKVVKKVCTDDELRGLIRKCEKHPEYGQAVIESKSKPLPDNWTPEGEVQKLAAAGVRIYATDAKQDETPDPPWWNLWLTTLITLDLDRKIDAALHELADKRGVPVETLIPLQDDLVEIREPKARRKRPETEQAMRVAAEWLEKDRTITVAAELSGISDRQLRNLRKQFPVQWELSQKLAKVKRPEK